LNLEEKLLSETKAVMVVKKLAVEVKKFKRTFSKKFTPLES